MPCALTQNYTLDCKDSLGGITEVYFIAEGDVTSTTEASGVITSASSLYNFSPGEFGQSA